VAGYLARFKGTSRTHVESDLRAYLGWCADRGLDPLAATRPHVELYVRWMQEIRRLKPSTTSRRMSIVAGFYPDRGHRRPARALPGRTRPPPARAGRLTDARADPSTTRSSAHRRPAPPNRCDFALVCLLGLLGLRIFEATSLNISDLGEEHGHRVLRVAGKGGRTVLIPLPPAVGRALDRAIGDRTSGAILLNRRGARMDRHAATRRLRALAQTTGMQMPSIHPHVLRHTYVTTMLDAGVDLRDVHIAARHADPRTTMRYDRARNQLDRHPNYILAAYMASGT
jgi:integrase/recombinase XerD